MVLYDHHPIQDCSVPDSVGTFVVSDDVVDVDAVAVDAVAVRSKRYLELDVALVVAAAAEMMGIVASTSSHQIHLGGPVFVASAVAFEDADRSKWTMVIVIAVLLLDLVLAWARKDDCHLLVYCLSGQSPVSHEIP
jgi:hypothetical protein